MDRSSLVTFARSYIGTPYFHAGKSRHGCDCVGLLLAVAEEAGVLTYTPPGYSAGWVDPDRLLSEIERFADSVEFGPVQDGDIGVFTIAGNPQHAAILTGSGTMIHAYQTVGKVVEHALAGAWERRLVGVWRLR
jgi:NlpC/P60 family putative phage cell wall peptidase